MRRREWSLRLEGELPPLWLGLLATLAAVAASTLLVYLLKPISPVVSLGVVYLPAILAISIFWGLRLGLLASLASVVAFTWRGSTSFSTVNVQHLESPPVMMRP